MPERQPQVLRPRCAPLRKTNYGVGSWFPTLAPEIRREDGARNICGELTICKGRGLVVVVEAFEAKEGGAGA